jgi:hypothetical protein
MNRLPPNDQHGRFGAAFLAFFAGWRRKWNSIRQRRTRKQQNRETTEN